MNCPSGTYDMLDWMTFDSNLRGTYHMTGTANPLYTKIGGWEVLLDQGRATVLLGTFSSTTANTFTCGSPNTTGTIHTRLRSLRKTRTCPWFHVALKAGFPGSDDTRTQHFLSDLYRLHHYKTQNLLKGINQVWGPYWVNLGGASAQQPEGVGGQLSLQLQFQLCQLWR